MGPPNPTNDQLTVLFDQPEEGVTLTVTDISGNIRIYYHVPSDKEALTLDVSSWQPGIWFLRAASSAKSETVKICITK
jgi:predicted membrane protein